MATTTYTGSGGLNVLGCASVSKIICVVYKYAEGSRLWLKYKAIKGCLESVVIKRVDFLQNRNTYNRMVPLYVDTYNAFYNENELIDEATAIELAKQYYEQQAALALKALSVSCS